MANKFLDDNGLLYFWQKIKNYVASVVPTKQSDLTNDDYTVKDPDYSTVKQKVATLEGKVDDIVTQGGEPNVIETVKVNGTALSVTDKAVNISAVSGTANGSIAINGTDVAVTGLGSAAYANTTQFDPAGSANTVRGSSADTAGTATVYGALASAQAAQSGVDAINAAGYQTSAQVTAAINDALADVTGISYEVITTFPATGQAGVIYLKANSGLAPNVYDEYIWYNNNYEKIGTTDVDLSGYMLTTDMVAITNGEIDSITANTPQSGS